MCLTCFKCMLLIKHKMMLFHKVASVGWMTVGGTLQIWYQSQGFDTEPRWAS
jgi:hypothetical protein